ncbi:ergothioneine biosynthesis protein EgtB [Chroococcidiopsis sp. CCMEE 29]|uniref:ergothioneine biosynthesis protein EgtB n=1 Tax=Chroococcidiopsis sp. CCMEE 29 TaxID=155894 RepID=UPI0020201486|nr:ergothioneine biosynthesis protein EgtB [Chroococcidiopsis sp. CCMEE 29]
MKSRSINFEPTNCQDATKSVSANSLDKRRQQLKQWLHECRLATLGLFKKVDDATFCRQAHPEFSPIGWHLGHIAYTESLWLLERGAGIPPLFPEYHRLFVADGLPKTERAKLPPQGEVRHYLEKVREQVLYCLETVDLNRHERLWRWLIQHESQHSETIAFVLQLQRRGQGSGVRGQGEQGRQGEQGEQGKQECNPKSKIQNPKSPRPSPLAPPLSEMLEVPAGYFEQGNDSIDALDNERPVHQVYLETYWIDRCPVTCGQYRAFIEAGGYQNPRWWSDAGWRWCQDQRITQPLYWLDDSRWDNHPVCGVSWYEAEAYARFVGKRLPTEAEWEKAASWDAASERRRTYPWGEVAPDTHKCNHNTIVGQTTPVTTYPAGQSGYGCYDLLGNVWEWTASVFQGYEGFMPYPYAGYSKVYFDGQHQVLKGGSWATHPWALRSSFRNWYHPGVRQILAGFRCASY